MAIRYIPESVSAHLITHELAMEAVSAALIAACDPSSSSFPVVLGHAGDPHNRFSLKSATTTELTGLKVGFYWSRNAEKNRPRHNSCIVLFDQAVGGIDTVIEGAAANGYRTAAANALAVEHLARRDASCLAVFGAGHQAYFECKAVSRVRPIREIHVVNRDPGRASRLAQRLETPEVAVRVSSPEDACAQADVIVTATASRGPLLDPKTVRPGTHVSCMGTDAVGKQELPPSLLLSAQVFCDYLPQSLVIGELQHIADAVRSGAAQAVNLGEVLSGRHPGRASEEAITVFDSSGLALQDLYLGAHLLREAERVGLVRKFIEAGASAMTDDRGRE